MRSTGHHSRGFTLIELMVVVAIGGLLIVLVGPSFRSMIDRQRVNSTNSQVVTDMQFARSEAASRARHVRVTFGMDASMSCYVIYTYNMELPGNVTRCNCLATPACIAAGSTEIRATRIPRDTGVTVETPANRPDDFAFDPLTGALYKIPNDREWDPLNRFVIKTQIDTQRALSTWIALSGRPTVCAPSGSTMQAQAC